MAKILVCDDSALIRIQLRKILEDEGHIVYEESNIDQIKSNTISSEISLDKIDLILLDIYLKDITGFQVLKYIKEKYFSIPIIIISVDNKKKSITKAISLGASDYIIKPFDKLTILEKINTVLYKKNSENNNLKLKTNKNFIVFISNLTLEISRTIRSKNSFTVVKIKLEDKANQQNITKYKNYLTNILRDIDRVFTISEKVIILLLPLTDKSGFNKLHERLHNSDQVFIDKFENIVDLTHITFPDDLTKNIDYKESKNYKNQIIDNLSMQ